MVTSLAPMPHVATHANILVMGSFALRFPVKKSRATERPVGVCDNENKGRRSLR